jgi:hypothetical protein
MASVYERGDTNMIDKQNWLNEVAVGMPVYDSQGHDTGTVAYVHLGVNGDAATWSFAPGVGSYEDSLPAEVRDMIPRDLEPPEIRQRMLQLGFLKISSGGISSLAHFALPEQIEHVNEDGVRLTVSRTRLLIL